MESGIVPMFYVKRDEILSLIAAKLASADDVLAVLRAKLEAATFEQVRTGMKAGIDYIEEGVKKVTWLRDHMAAGDGWSMNAAQCLEVRTSLEPFAVPEGLDLVIEPQKQIAVQQHGVNGRGPRW
jgi:hypothetical protein